MNIVALSIIAIIATFLSLVLKKYNPEYSLVISIVASILILSSILTKITPAIDLIKDFIAQSNIPSKYLMILFKAMGICFLTQFSADACKDAGEGALSAKVELAGKIAIILIALPMFEDVMQIILKLVSK